MVLTLWFSKKARSVTETEVNLARQNTGMERFDPNLLAQSIVRTIRNLSSGFIKYLPERWIRKINIYFRPIYIDESTIDRKPPAFDLIRASVNLTMASVLIAFATSLKLPLSTTYVSFMVAMGTSLSDRAWGRESAVFRVAGVVTVIGGWFLTALVAFFISGVFALLIYYFGIWAIAGLVVIAVVLVSRTFLHFRKSQKERVRMETLEMQNHQIPAQGMIDATAKNVVNLFKELSEIFRNAIHGLVNEDRKMLKRAKKNHVKLIEQHEEFHSGMFGSIKRLEDRSSAGSRLYLLVYDLEQDMLQSAGNMIKACRSHVANSFDPPTKKQISQLNYVLESLENYLNYLSEIIKNRSFDQIQHVIAKKQILLTELERILSNQMEGIKRRKYGKRNSLLFFSLILETKDIIAVAARFVKLFSHVK